MGVVSCGFVIPHTGRHRSPVGIIEGRFLPGFPERAIGWNEGLGGWIGVEQDRRSAVAILHEAIGNIFELRWEWIGGGTKFCDHGGAIGVDQGEGVTIGELEIGVECGVGKTAIFLRGIDQKEGTAVELDGGKGPLCERCFIVGQEIAVEVDPVGAGIEYLDPVGGVSIFILQRSSIESHELGDVKIGMAGKDYREGDKESLKSELHGIADSMFSVISRSPQIRTVL